MRDKKQVKAMTDSFIGSDVSHHICDFRIVM